MRKAAANDSAIESAGSGSGTIGSPVEVLFAFLKLGFTSFGGPIAHLGYFRREFVMRRRWLDEHAYADLVSLCQFLPGPASSQVGFAIGLSRAGYVGGLAAWLGFTLPSALALVLFGMGARFLDAEVSGALLHGLKLVAVAIVAQAVWSMAQALCPDRARKSIAVLAALVLFFTGSLAAQLLVMLLGGLLGLTLLSAVTSASATSPLSVPVSNRVGLAALTVYVLLLAGLPLLQFMGFAAIAPFAAFYRSGALVFGGGHVVLPLLREAFVVPGWITDDVFVSGYGAAQAVPGPLFSFAAYLGAVISEPPRGIVGALCGLVAIFLPGILILLGTLPFWARLHPVAPVRAALYGVNAAVVGLLAMALYNPLWTSSVSTPIDAVLALAGCSLLVIWRMPPLLVVLLMVAVNIVVIHL